MPQLEGNRSLAALLFAGGALLLIALLIIRMRRQQAQRRSAYRPPRERLKTIRKDAAQRDDLHTTMADVEELTRRCAAHLDNKAARLEYLITLADDRLARLEAPAGGEPVPSPAARDEDPTAPLADLRPDPEGPPPPTRRQMTQRATRTAQADAAPNVFDAAQVRAGDGLPSPVITEPPDDPLTRRVYQMADRGAEPVEIAQTLDEQVGKVELILALRSA